MKAACPATEYQRWGEQIVIVNEESKTEAEVDATARERNCCFTVVDFDDSELPYRASDAATRLISKVGRAD